MESKKNIGEAGVVCTRYAPSPTGHLHIGGARTALFNYLLAKKYEGKFILRIEDTDEERNVPDGHFAIEHDLKCLDIFPDESFSIPGPRGPYLQSQKLERYESICNQLIEEGKAYRCFCTEKELDDARQAALKNNSTPIYSKKCRFLSKEEIHQKLQNEVPFAVRLKVDILDEYKWKDLVRGEISIPSDSMSDAVIMRSNKRPTYNFAVVIDDYDMGINYVLRGEEHISNTSVQIAIYHALAWQDQIPFFGHLSIIVDNDRKKLSKRSGDEFHFISGLLRQGYPSEAIFNFLALLGWSHEEQEIFSQEDLVKAFSLEALSKAPAFFDIKKLNWISHKYFQDMSSHYYLNFVHSLFDIDLGVHNERKSVFALANKNNICCASQLNQLALDFYSEKKLLESQVIFLKKHRELLKAAIDYFPRLSETWTQVTIRNYLKQLMQVSEARGKNFFKPLRIAVSFMDEGFELANVFECLGRDLSLENLKKAFLSIHSE